MSVIEMFRCVLMLVAVSTTTVADQKRLLMHSQDDIFAVIANLQTELESLKANFTALEASKTAEIEALKTQISSSNVKITSLETEVSSSHADVTSLKTQVSTSNAKVTSMETQISSSIAEVTSLKTEVTTLRTALQSNSGSDVYIRWGRTTCPTNGTEFVYKGYMAGAHVSDDGGGSNSLCLPENPTWNHYVDGFNGGATIYGTETDIDSSVSSALFGKPTYDQDIPCAVCKTQATSVMIPARSNCYPGWNLEYSGYVIAAYPSWKGKSDYVCLDAGYEFVPHGGGNDDAHIVRVVEVKCGQAGGLPCPPYVDGRELACVVCSK